MARTSSSPTSHALPRLREDARIACVVSAYHPEIGASMRDSARALLVSAGLAPDDFVEASAPGAFELPIVAAALAERGEFDAILCFGLLLEGETDHDRIIAHAVANALQRLALDARVPVLFGVLTCATLEQAGQRARRLEDGGLDKGREVALAAIGVLEALRAVEDL
jgi:6,7-dimethyl-8-ribityllumazine synthase